MRGPLLVHACGVALVLCVVAYLRNTQATDKRAMHTIALVSRKGGTGKSTLAIGLAVAAMEAGHTVCLLEADPLGTVSNWRRRRTSAEPTVEVIHDGYRLFHRVQALARRGITLTIVDTAGGWSDACTGAMAAADLCLIPTRPSPADIDATAPMLTAVRESGKPFAFVLNQVQARSTRLNGAAGSLGKRAIELKMSHVLALPAIVLRNDQQDALGIGLGVTEHAPRGKSAEEIRGLWRWISARLSCASQRAAEAPAHTHAPLPAAVTVADAPAALPAPG
jgi:chromosome partitioning protein